MSRKWIVEIISALLILTFVYTSLSKYYDFNSFKSVLGQSPLIGEMSTLVAWGLPAVELIVSFMLFIPKFRKVGLYCSLVLMSLFTLYIGFMLIFEENLPCQCGGVISRMTWPQHLAFNILLTLLALIALRIERKRGERKSLPDQSEMIIST